MPDFELMTRVQDEPRELIIDEIQRLHTVWAYDNDTRLH